MIIEDNSNGVMFVNEVKPGEVFLYANKYFIRTDFVRDELIMCVIIETGFWKQFSPSDVVKVCHAKAVIE